MTNRTGKREREARNRPKRGWTYGYAPGGARLTALKLGRKKQLAFSRSTRFEEYNFKCFNFAMAAVPVTEAERQVQTVVERGS